MTDTAAIAAIARILRAPPSPDPDVLAAHILAALRGHGWRPTNTVQLLPMLADPLPAERTHELAARARQAITTREDDHDHT